MCSVSLHCLTITADIGMTETAHKVNHDWLCYTVFAIDQYNVISIFWILIHVPTSLLSWSGTQIFCALMTSTQVRQQKNCYERAMNQ